MSAVTLLALGALGVLAAGVQSAVGFGQSLLLAPGLFAAGGAEEAVVAALVLSTVTNVLVLATERRRPAVRGPLVTAMTVGAVPGLAAGAALLAVIAKPVLQVAVGLLILAALVARSRRRLPAGDRPGPRDLLAGAASGLLNTTTSLSGPPLVLRLQAHGLRADALRDTLTAALLTLNVLGLVAIAATVAPEALVDGARTGAVLTPAALVGHRLGRAVFVRLGADRHLRTVRGLIALAAAASIVAGLA